MKEINFLQGPKENYEKLASKDENAIYFTKDTDGNMEIHLNNSSWSNDEIILGELKKNEKAIVTTLSKVRENVGLTEGFELPSLTSTTYLKYIDNIVEGLETLDNKIGDLDHLTTSRKENLVLAINEVKDIATSLPQREYVTVALSSEVEGVSVSGLNLYVYVSNIETPISVITDENGLCSFHVDCNLRYRIVFPQIQGCENIMDITRIASVREHSIEVEYKEKIEQLVETCTTFLYLWASLSSTPFVGGNVTVSYNNNTFVYETDDKGRVSFDVPLNTEYSVKVDDVYNDEFYCFGTSRVIITAKTSQRNLIFNYHNMEVGLFYVDNSGGRYSYKEWLESGKDGSEAIAIYFGTSTLLSNNGTFLIKIDDIYTSRSGQWCGSLSQFNSVPLNGASSSTQPYYYDGKTASSLIINESKGRGLSVGAFVTAQSCKLTVNGNELIGFIGSYGQWAVVRNNLEELNAMIRLVRPNKTTDFSYLLSTAHWTSTQFSAGSAWYLSSGFNFGNSKNISLRVLPFFAF